MPLTNISGAQYQYLSCSPEHHHEIHSNHMCYLGALPLPSQMPCLVSMTFTMTFTKSSDISDKYPWASSWHSCLWGSSVPHYTTDRCLWTKPNLHTYVICTYEPSRVYTSGWCLYPPPCYPDEMRYSMGIKQPWLVLMSHIIAHKLLIGVHKH